MGGETVEDRFGAEAPAALDGVNLYEGCPNCGRDEDRHTFEENPAGYYTCLGCWCTWSGDPADASLVLYLGGDDDGE
ncbi:hypothetical protein ACKVMT_10090 [Halobacteriales archaeon Cl-PHB]